MSEMINARIDNNWQLSEMINARIDNNWQLINEKLVEVKQTEVDSRPYDLIRREIELIEREQSFLIDLLNAEK
tara:strand:+ start:57 stop:275 length:219 start_codon:yes stop_codon:yes gene_type:complete